MAIIQVPANPGFPDVYQWELDDDVIGGPDGIATRPIRQLTERTANLKTDVEFLIGGVPFIAAAASDKRKIVIRGIEFDVASILDTGSLTNGRDYYVFEYPTINDQSVYSVSLSKTAPGGFVGTGFILIGGFHTLCVDVGTSLTYVEGSETKDHPLNGYVAGDILPASVWCLNHRPHSEPEGMVYINLLDVWVDIYLQSGSGTNTRSAFQGAITRSRQYVDHVEDMFCVKKELLNDPEFAAAMLGSNEQTNVQGSNQAGATDGGAGGRVDTAGRRMISIFGVEEGCGSLWQWMRENFRVWSGEDSQDWVTQSGGKGDHIDTGALLAGGAWSDAARCGSRCRAANTDRSSASSFGGGRGRSRTRR